MLHVFEGHAFAVDMALSADGLEVYVSAEDTVYRMDLATGQVLAQQAVARRASACCCTVTGSSSLGGITTPRPSVLWTSTLFWWRSMPRRWYGKPIGFRCLDWTCICI